MKLNPYNEKMIFKELHLKKDLIQILNPKSHKYVLIDRSKGKIIKHHPRSDTPYKHITIIRYVSPHQIDEINIDAGVIISHLTLTGKKCIEV